MADTKISALTSGSSVAATDRFPLARSPYGSGDNRYVDGTMLDAFISATATALTNKPSITLTGGTVTSSTPVLDATQTWNNSGVTFTGWKLNVTDTTSASASMLMDLQVAASSVANVRKDGLLQANYLGVKSGATSTVYLYGPTGGNLQLFNGTGDPLTSLGFGTDLILARDAANTLALRNSTNAQTFNLYDTYTDVSNYRRVAFGWSGGDFIFQDQSAGTGVAAVAVAFKASGASGVVDFYANSSRKLRVQNANVQVTNATLQLSSSCTAYETTAIPAGGTAGAGYMFSSTANFGVFFGSGAPTLSAAKGSLYLRSDGSTTNDRMYVNTNGSTTWTAVTTAA